MYTRRSEYHPSTKFSILTDTENVASARKNYLTWILIVTLLFCLTAASLSYKIFIAPLYFNEQISPSTENNDSVIVKHTKSPLFKFYNPTPLLSRFRKRIKDVAEFACGEYQMREAVPSLYKENIFQNNFESVNDFINFDLLLHYDNIINKNPPTILKLIFNEYQYKLLTVKNSQDFEDFLMVLKSNKFKFYSAQLKQQKYDLKLELFQNYFALTDEFNRWYNFLDRLRGFLSSYEQVKLKKYFEVCEEKNFETVTEEIQKYFFPFVYSFKITEKKLEEINEVINEWTQPLKIDSQNCSILFYNRVVILSDINAKILTLNNSCLKNVYIFASSKIYLDEDLELLGVNLAIFAPKWEFLKKIKINLDGEIGRNHANGTSTPFQPGEPGYPGGNAGDFIGVGNMIEKFLSISTNGGKGGDGQNGAKGHDGADHTWPGPPINKPACVTKIKAFNNTFGEVITHYAVYNETGCGGSGEDGGVGGVGGAGGVITLIDKSNVKIRKGLNGVSGIPGKGGAGGVGGHNACFYEVLDVNDEILHPVTRVKCPGGNILPSGKFGKDSRNVLGQIFPPGKENFSLYKCLLTLFRFAGGDFIKHKDANLLSFLKEFKRQDLYNETNLTDIINEYEILKVLEKAELYSIFYENIKHFHTNGTQTALKYLKSIVLGKMLILKKNVDFFFIDLKNYLKFLRRNIINTNMNIPEKHSLLHFKKKVGIKWEQVKLNIERIKTRIFALSLSGESCGESVHTNQTLYSSKRVEERKIACLMIAIIDVYFLINQHSGDKKIGGLTTLGSYNVSGNNTKMESLIEDGKKILFKIVNNLENEEEVKEDLVKLKHTLCLLKHSDALSFASKNLLGALTHELEHFIALYYFIKWEGLENSFSKSLDEIKLNKSTDFEESKELIFLKRELVDVVVAVQYKLALNAVRQRLFPLVNNSLQFLQKEITTSNVLTQIDILQDIANQDFDSFCKNHLKAVFNKDSAVGEFYFWSNTELKHELKKLFSGAEINLNANIINRHVFDKNFIQFASLKLEFECSENGSSCQKRLNKALVNFKIEMTHSGYSYYNWKGETLIVISEKVSLNYSFKMKDNKEPEVYNSLFKKCQNGEIRLSPFTTWSVRLLPLNDDAEFAELAPLADTVSLRLTGIGTYTS